MINTDPLTTPVLLLLFNRYETAKLVFDEIRRAKPSRLYVAADGPREHVPEEFDKCKRVRSLIEQVDWDCEIQTLFRETNLGCKLAVSSGITWFFDNVESGIILEDDCLPSQSFFWFCQELLETYRYDTRIMHIAGCTYVEKTHNPQNYSYHFARVGGIWGWASWRRAWLKYELEMESWPQAKKEKILRNLFLGEEEQYRFFEDWFERAYQNKYTWDYQWTYTKLINSSLNIMPCKNLIRNIGHGSLEATHTLRREDRYSRIPLNAIEFPLNHPKFVTIDREFNYANFQIATRTPTSHRIRRIIARFLPTRLKNFLSSLLYKS